jgi:hypothetical protein
MGMFSEIHNEVSAVKLQTPLLVAIESNNKDLFAFCKKFIYPIYVDHMSEVWSPSVNSSDEHLRIISAFE